MGFSVVHGCRRKLEDHGNAERTADFLRMSLVTL
jgi:hypothetical protein